ncbi:hypothetical protein C5167_034102 [Papaver somniferum]|uniref:CCHC-type domain-containing protein n=1 Tax=Papaver somniferum TaxID=3469 RepID=A0A4Y7KFK4_PAPSO|nr:hypothetical protein C5167_034102 [Papaver somniferum]
MVSQRQKLARKKFKEENPGLFPKAEPTPPKNPNSTKKKKKSKFKPNKKDGPDSKGVKTNKTSFRKHPLRVPGMKPGESCYICKGVNHIAKNCPEKDQWEKNKICLLCRHRGHSLKNCPDKIDETVDSKFCYNCGVAGHPLSRCPQPLQDGGTKFASCFICNERGHLSKNCPKNTHGIYPKHLHSSRHVLCVLRLSAHTTPTENGGSDLLLFSTNSLGYVHFHQTPVNHGGISNVVKSKYSLKCQKGGITGGSCKICGGITHLAKDCPNKRNLSSNASGGVGSIRAANEYEGKPRVTKIVGGDDLEDDFMMEEADEGNKSTSLSTNIASLGVQNEKYAAVKPKKQGPKVVNFFG